MEPAEQGLEASTAPFTEALRASKDRRGGSAGDYVSRLAHALLVAACAVMILTTLFCLLVTIVLADNGVRAMTPIVLNGLATFLAAPGALWLVAASRDATWHLRLAVVYAMLNWALRALLWLNTMIIIYRVVFWEWCVKLWSDGPTLEEWERASSSDWSAVDLVLKASIFLAIAAMIAFGAQLSILRLKVLERSCLVDLHHRPVQWAFCSICLMAGVLVAAEVARGLHEAFRVLQVATLILAIVTAVGATGLFLHGVWRALRLAGEACERAPQGRAAQARSTRRALLMELLSITAMAATSATLIVLYGSAHHIFSFQVPHQENLILALGVVDAVCNEWFALSLSGAVSGAVRGSAARAAAGKERRRRWRLGEAQWLGRWQEGRAEEWQQWDEKVCELAGRGISLEALLRFYRDLPSLMTGYDPCRHTTNDVVRGAIIPFSASQRSACSSVLMDGKFTLPNKMVTHNWSNLFMDLLAAIVADALGEREFSMVSDLLRNDLARLEKWVDHAKAGGKTYWVCAFAVNQHAGICGSVFPDAKDTVTGIRPTPCKCGLEKAWNDTEPLLPDGRGVPCEMNKFDDMMKFLAAADPAFGQVVAIDAKFTLFSRAWCVAEIATASWAGMVQGLVIHSKEAMSERTEQLRKLRIQDMEATRVEDKEEILSSISDLDAFNANLQKLLFEELFPAWSSLDAAERMATGGAVIRWLPVWAAAAKRGNAERGNLVAV